MKYKFDVKTQFAYGLVTFGVAFAILYFATLRPDVIAPAIAGLANFALSGYYTNSSRFCR
ncbi:Uncharacterised protein [uncultured archaeon]|nr:Uncharacterised protein [uncultured archaeon]